MDNKFNPRPNPDYVPGVNYNKYKIPQGPPVRRDLKYPLTVKNGGLMTSTDLDITQEAIYSVIETETGERVMRQDYGLDNQLFQAIYPGLVDVEVKRAIAKQIDEIDDLVTRMNTSTDLENGSYGISVFWTANNRIGNPVNLEISS